MVFKLGISLLCLMVSMGGACGSTSGANQNPPRDNVWQAISDATTNPAEVKSEATSKAGTASSPGLIDTCALIEKSEITSAQGVEVGQTQPTSQKAGDLAISQCYYTAISADGLKNLSVFIQVIQLDPTSARRDALKEFWKERFGRENKEKRKEGREAREEEEEGEEALNPPRRVPGVGDEAFWLGSSRGGALFVLKRDRVLRITVGGSDDAKAQLEKSKMLAAKALTRLM